MLFAPPGFMRYDYIKVLQKAAKELTELRDIVVLSDIADKHQIASNSFKYHDYESFLESRTSDKWSPDPTISCHDMVNVQFTSGSTGLPKSVSLSHYNIMNCGRYIWHQTRMTSEDRIACPVPLFHSFGMIVGTSVYSLSFQPLQAHTNLHRSSNQHQHRRRLRPRLPV